MCVVAAAAASWLALLAAPRLYPAVCQTAKQGKRWDKWLFMICHIPSSLLSPGPIYYSCRLPLCRRERAHTQILNTALCVRSHGGQTHTHTHAHHLTFSNILFCPKQHISGTVCCPVICSVVGTLQTSSNLHSKKSEIALLPLSICIQCHMADEWYFPFSLHVSHVSLRQTFCGRTQ